MPGGVEESAVSCVLLVAVCVPVLSGECCFCCSLLWPQAIIIVCSVVLCCCGVR